MPQITNTHNKYNKQPAIRITTTSNNNNTKPGAHPITGATCYRYKHEGRPEAELWLENAAPCRTDRQTDKLTDGQTYTQTQGSLYRSWSVGQRVARMLVRGPPAVYKNTRSDNTYRSKTDEQTRISQRILHKHEQHTDTHTAAINTTTHTNG